MQLDDISLLSLGQVIQMAEQLLRIDRAQDAAGLYAVWCKCNTSSPELHVAFFNQGVIHSNLGDISAALLAYRASLDSWANFPQARINLGLLLERQGLTEQAFFEWQQVTGDVDMQVIALNHCGRLHESMRQYKKAEEVLAKSLHLKPDQPDAIQHWVHLRQKQCKWPVMRPMHNLSVNRMMANTSPLAMLSLHDDPAIQMMSAKLFINRKFDLSMSRLCSEDGYCHQRLRIGYLSGDLCTHAVGLLLAEMIECHDRKRFEVFAFDYSPEDGSPYRERLRQSFENFISVKGMSDAQAAKIIASQEIDVLIDLHGLSLGARPGIMALRPAPHQGTYLGFMGTTGFPWVDFVITDRYVFQEHLIPYYSERPLYVEGCVLPIGHNTIAPSNETRASLGLKEDAFVLVCFNNVYKFNSTIFAVWMRVLQQVDDAVLWLLDDNESATQQIEQFVAANGVSRERVIFAKRTSHLNYRARLQLADLYLDTNPYNAGSTACDVVDAGLPMVTLSGQTVVSRMAGSLLTSLGLSELVTRDVAEYESLILKLAQDRSRLLTIHEALVQSAPKRTQATAQLTKSLEYQLLNFL
jgi:predicted O-linked N-acetylglucosamine transferase (SPINDLY family)